MQEILNNTIYVFWLCMLLHLLADFHFQGVLANMKQKSWWQYQVKKRFGPTEEANRATRVFGGKLEDHYELPTWYDYDWFAGLLCHAAMWGIITYLPMIYTTKAWLWSVLVGVNICLHAIVDHLKCNRIGTLNLNQDQFLHLVQVACSVVVWHFVH